MNILFFLTPKAQVRYVGADDTLRQALEKMDHYQYASVPIVDEKTGRRKAEDIPLRQIPRKRDYLPITASANIEDIVQAAISQNFVPVVDDLGCFIGIITRREVIRFLQNCTQSDKAGQV